MNFLYRGVLLMKFDFHTHHDRCGHAVGKIEDYIKQAIEYGMDMIGISDHSPFFGSDDEQPQPATAMAKREFSNYVQEVLRLKDQYHGRIEVLLGVESDFFPEHAEIYREVYRQYPLDYIIGSVHVSNGISIFRKSRWEGLTEQDKVQEKEIYNELIQQSARSGMFDILGHIDAIKTNYPEYSSIPTDVVDQTLKVISECDVAIEVNTSGRIKKCAEWHPTLEILERAHFHGVKVTFGSDSHKPERVGDEWEIVRSKLKEIGYKEWAIFRKRQRELLPL
jgi:histidinol-phosphatase (PHP family)